MCRLVSFWYLCLLNYVAILASVVCLGFSCFVLLSSFFFLLSVTPFLLSPFFFRRRATCICFETEIDTQCGGAQAFMSCAKHKVSYGKLRVKAQVCVQGGCAHDQDKEGVSTVYHGRMFFEDDFPNRPPYNTKHSKLGDPWPPPRALFSIIKAARGMA